MVKRLLIDATHNEEVRIAVVNGSSVEEFDSETANKRQIKSNIYLAKVIRVEPSLQAAFVEYSGGRHGFLPFAEIHPDYYRIPVADRKELEENLALEMGEDSPRTADDDGVDNLNADNRADAIADEPSIDLPEKTPKTSDTKKAPKRRKYKAEAVSVESDDKIHESIIVESVVSQEDINDDSHSLDTSEAKPSPDAIVEHKHAENVDDITENVDHVTNEKRRLRFRYKIQEVIKRRQILLVQVVKEERGNKGAALTTYLSLPGRYCVLMPNAGHRAGGVSRKISDNEDRRRLRDLMKEFGIPDGMSLIVRTAGQERNKAEIRRDYEYLLRVWDDIREKTMQSVAPELVYAEGDLVKRAIRDVYDRDIEEILIEGDEAHKAAKIFMKSLIPSHVKKIKLYKDNLQPLFHRFNVEEQIEKMHEPVVSLPSGGSIVINHTEALVAIDVNSGKSTRERNIDDTALKTNIEAAVEIARQLRLRDIGGLIVVDFIDMHENAHIAQVERKVREALKNDRARIQIGRISQFGLLEFSRQRLRPSLLESHSITCTHCRGTGLIRSVDSMALQILRDIERIAIGGKAYDILAVVPDGVDLFLLNQKRATLVQIESRFDVRVTIERDHTLISPNFHLDILSERPKIVKILSDNAPKDTKKEQLAIKHDEQENESVVAEDEAQEASALQNNVKEKRHGRRRRQTRRNGRDNRSKSDESSESDDSAVNAPSNVAEAHVNKAEPLTNVVAVTVDEMRSEHVSEQRGNGNSNRRRRHPYQRRQHVKEGNGSDHSVEKVSTDETVSAAKTSASDVVPINREPGSSSKQAHHRTPREPRKDALAMKEKTSTGDDKKSKSWIRRLLDV